MSDGIVFNIQKFSIHDGPGVRTTVFLKGCPLRCAWCSNPESQSARVQVMYDGKACVKCGACAADCTQGAVIFDGEGVTVDHAKCVGCLSCVRGCPARALSHEGDRMTPEEVFEVCMQDADFYAESGGGVTVSGGEGLMQAEFVASLVSLLKAEGIHTAIETTGCVSEEIFRATAPLFDLLLFDVKHYDPDRHREGTGVGNELILKNLSWATENGIDILPRIPVIPGFNDSLSDAEGLSSLLIKKGAKRVQLLPFHTMGERKYEFLGRKYAFSGQKPLHPEDLEGYRAVFTEKGLDCFF